MKIIFIIFCILSCQLVFGQAKPGFYLTTDFEPEVCAHKMKLLNTEIVHCLAEEPVIEVDLIKKVGKLDYDSVNQMRGFQIVLSKKGGDFVRTVSRKLSNNKLALVVNGILVFTIELDGIYAPNGFTIWDSKNSKSIDWIHRSLVDSVTKYQKKS